MVQYRKNDKWGIKTINLKSDEILEIAVKEAMFKLADKLKNDKGLDSDIQFKNIDIVDIRSQIVYEPGNPLPYKNVEIFYALV